MRHRLRLVDPLPLTANSVMAILRLRHRRSPRYRCFDYSRSVAGSSSRENPRRIARITLTTEKNLRPASSPGETGATALFVASCLTSQTESRPLNEVLCHRGVALLLRREGRFPHVGIPIMRRFNLNSEAQVICPRCRTLDETQGLHAGFRGCSPELRMFECKLCDSLEQGTVGLREADLPDSSRVF